jgi:ATP-binding cassette subfamily F protein 3
VQLALASNRAYSRYVEQEIVGDDTTALDSVLQADVWRHKLIKEEAELNAQLEALEKKPAALEGDTAESAAEASETNAATDNEKDELASRLGDIQKKLVDMEAETGPARAGLLLAGLGFSDADQKMPTRSFSGGWRMRLALARALFVKPDVSVVTFFSGDG